MNSIKAALAILIFPTLCALSWADAPNLQTYQGTLQESGALVNGNRDVNISLCTALTGGVCTPTGTQSVAFSSGVFRSTFSAPSTINLAAGAWYLEISMGPVGGALAAFSPREQLTSSPFALVATTATTAVLKTGDTMTGPLTVAGATLSVTGLDAQGFSLSLSSGINTPAGTINGGLFVGNGIGLTNVVLKGGGAMTGQLTVAGATLTITGLDASGNSLKASYGIAAGSATLTGGLTASSGTFTAAGPNQYSLSLSSGINAPAGTIVGGLFIGNGAGLTNVIAAGAVAKTGDTMTGQLTVAGTTLSVTGLDAEGNGLKVSYGVAAGSATLTGGLTASSGTFTASGANQYSLSLSSGINAPAGTIVGGLFNGNGAGLTNVVLSGGGTMTGALVLNADPSAALGAATKQYVDSWTGPCVNPADANDIMVPVGDLCVDKYETSAWSTQTGGTQYGINGAADYPCGNGATGTGQTCAAAGTKIYARSVSGVKPSTTITWFQANIACTNAGKHLLSNAEWQAAAAGTPDPGSLAQDAGPQCNTAGTASMTTGAGTSCRSSYDVENMIGSVWEWVADWGQYGMLTGVSSATWTNGTATTSQWPNAAYNADASYNVAGVSYNGSAYVNGLPAALLRGGGWVSGASAGVFALYAADGPSGWSSIIGFRCGRRR